MNRALLVGFILLAFSSCQLPPEQMPLKPLPENGPPLPFADLVSRARVQAGAANEAFYLNKWSSLEDAARGLGKTAQYLSRSTEVPAKHKDRLAVEAGDLGKEAEKLREAAKAQEVKQANESLQQITLQIRELRPEE